MHPTLRSEPIRLSRRQSFVGPIARRLSMEPAMNANALSTKMSRSEMIVAGLAVVVLVAGFASGVFAKPVPANQHGPWLGAHVASLDAQDKN
jgi:hypothetical protein